MTEPVLTRIGIDVGGTFTKGVAVAPSGELLAVAHVPTTHTAERGVAEGVLQALEAVLGALPPHATVTLVAHSTTQATNALLEGDVARVGVLALAEARDERRVRPLTRLPAALPGEWAFVATDAPDFDARVLAALEVFTQRGVQALAVSQAFGVDDPTFERQAARLARSRGWPVSQGSDLSGAYGLELRTLSAAVNASILPTMLRTAAHVREAVSARLPGVPLLIIRGDGGAASLKAFEEMPLHTVVSGPAASLSGALVTRGIMDGVFFEVGGTSTNVGAIRDGQPVLKYMTVLDVPTGLRAADIRIAGVAGGSLVRVQGRRIQEVGPRSAHIAGLPYASFAPPGQLHGARLIELPAPAGQSGAYIALQTPDGARYAVTPTCAAGALGAVQADDRAQLQPDSARLAMRLLGERLGADADRAAQAVLEASAEKIVPLVADLMRDQQLRGAPLYGGGGAARVLGPVVARRLGVPFHVLEHADIISSIGAARAVIRVERERTVTRQDPTIADLLEREVGDEAVRLGADPATVRVDLSFDAEVGRLRAVAVGAHPLSAQTRTLAEDELHQQARALLGDATRRVFQGGRHSLYTAQLQVRHFLRRTVQHPAVVLDARGVPLLRLHSARVLLGSPQAVLEQLEAALGPGPAPHVAALTPSRLRDYAHLHDRRVLLETLRENVRLEREIAVLIDQET
ncbi:hydantoinase/oxoprolinase family protein [Deinococcus sonorensis]|uniref:Hydantoinase/oxoprolinase family protein n=2 Tax=Deinococcus sonorensis TaxID=309891 RepID=A0AAU7UC25_9DEIO